MGKHGSTKTKILKLISQGDNTLSGISKALDMSPSTVSKHIHDLQVSGAIEQQENEHIKKWKYYRVSGTEQNNNPDWTLWRRSDRAMQITAIMGLLIIGALTYAFTAYNSGGAYIPISITDPPAVPPGTQALFINYSSLSIYVHNAGTSEWLPINASGRLNLMSLINESQVIGGVTLPAGAKISYAKFNITSASIVIGNTTYPVHLIGSAVTATVENNSKLNSSSGILLDFAPVVGNIYAQNSSYFIMLPSLRAVIVSDHNVEFGQVGRVSQSQQQLMPKYAEMFSATNPSIGIRNATMQLNGNSVAFSITLNNTSPENITIMGVWLRTFGKFNYSGIGAENRNITVNGSGFYLYRAWGMGMGRQGINDSSQMGFIIYKRMGNSTNIEINDSAVQQLGYMGTRRIVIRLPNPVSNISIYEGNAEIMHKPLVGYYGFSLCLQADSNGTLSVPKPVQMHRTGFGLSSDEQATLSYKGTLTVPFGMPVPSKNTTYQAVVMTNDGTAIANVTVK